MKKLFVSAIAAIAMLASCSSDSNTNENGTDPVNPIAGPTYATFNFSVLGNKTRALGDFAPDAITPDDTKDAAFGFADLRLMIFDATSKACEYNELISATEDRTVLLTAGNKKIFVFANTGKLNDAGGTNSPSDFNNKVDKSQGFQKGGSKSLTDFYALAFDAGVAQHFLTDADKNVARTFKYNGLYDRANDPTLGIPASNTNAIDYVLKSNVTQTQASGGTASLTGDSPTNTFSIQLEYMAGKARLVLASDVKTRAAAEDGTVIGDVKYGIKNLAKYTNYVQKVENGVAKSYYYDFFNPANPDDQSVFDPHMDYAAYSNENATMCTLVGGVQTPAANTPFVFVPENNSSNILRGQSSYYAMKAQYEPGIVICDVEFDGTAPVLGGLVNYTEKTLSACGSVNGEGALDYIYTLVDIKDGSKVLVPAKKYFKSYTQFLKAIWTEKNRSNAWTGNGTAAQQAEAEALLPAAPVKAYYSYKGATSWYRIDLGIGEGQNVEYGVLRGNAYTAIVSAINGPGVPTEKDLTENPGEPVKASTYISVQIIAAKWNQVSWTGPVE